MMPAEEITEHVVCDPLDERAASFAAGVKPEHWISGEDEDESISYCRPCGEAEVAKRGGERILDGGWPGESDRHRFCETCGSPLEVGSLTDYGCEEELAHFEEHGFDLSSPEECYWLLLLFRSACWSEGELVTRVHRLAALVVSALHPAEAPSGERLRSQRREES